VRVLVSGYRGIEGGELMPHHFTKATVEASIFCQKCMKFTPWRIADGRRQFCLVCYDRPTERQIAKQDKADRTLSLFEEE